MLIFSILLIRLTFHYHRLYTYSSIIATIATNLVLYGIADTLAQSITAYFTGIKIKLHENEILNNYRPRTQSIVTKYIHNLTNTRYNSYHHHSGDDNNNNGIRLDDTDHDYDLEASNEHTNAQDFFLDYGDNGDQGSINSSYDLSSSVSSLPSANRPSAPSRSSAPATSTSANHEVTFQIQSSSTSS
ncbi:hypothetical protein B5S32_g5396 [[Candida] boidinii]|nr:hypothetical protein B5S29_g2710 [[Candida] boidinii]OWB81050.1 hypothetical protein B5S32_g5396 [[Candida] boidinii]